jgi:hypothetical protein
MPKSQHHRRIAETEAEAPDITIYPNRHRMIGWIALSGIPTLCCGLFTIGLIILMILIPDVRDQGGAIFLTIMMGSFFVMSAWLTRMLFFVTFSGKPTLVISHKGIRVGKIYGFSDIFLPWEEVEAVYCSINPPYTLLCIRPIDNKLFFARLSPLMSFTCRLSTMSGAPIALYQSFLDQPIEEILEQMQTRYKRELELHQGKKQAAKMLSPQSEEQEIILYTSRWHLWIAALFMSLCLLVVLTLLFSTPRQLLTIFMSLLFLSGSIVFGPFLAWRILRVPVFIIDDEGISSPHLLRHTKIKWEEIDAIYGRTGGHLLIDASPSGVVALLARGNKGRLVIPRHMDITMPQRVFTIAQSMLPIPLDRLLEQISERFQSQW